MTKVEDWIKYEDEVLNNPHYGFKQVKYLHEKPYKTYKTAEDIICDIGRVLTPEEIERYRN